MERAACGLAESDSRAFCRAVLLAYALWATGSDALVSKLEASGEVEMLDYTIPPGVLLLKVVDGLPTSPYHNVWQPNHRWHNAALREQLRATIAEGEDDYCDGEELALEESSRVLSATAKAQVRARLAQRSSG